MSSFNKTTSGVAFFAAISYVVDYSFQLVDIYWVAKIGLGAPTAIAIISSVFFLIFAINEIIGAGTVPLFTRAIGAGDKERAGLVIMQSLLTKFVSGLLMTAIFFVFLYFIAPLYDINAQTRAYLYDYGNVIWISLIILPVYASLMTSLRAVGEVSKTAWISAIALLLNMVLNPLLIFGLNYGWVSFSGFGIAGAAWSTILAQLFAFSIAAFFLKRNHMGIEIFTFRNFSWQPDMYQRFLVIGLPVGAIVVLYNLEQTAIAAIAASFPTEVSDGYGIGARIYGFLFMANFAIAVAVSISTGQHLGRGEAEIVQRELPKFTLGALCVVATAAAVLALTGPQLIALFTSTEIAIKTGSMYLLFMAAVICFLCILNATNGAFMGAGRNMPLLFVSACTYLALEFPLIYLMTRIEGFSLTWLWAIVLIANVFAATLTAWLFYRGWWRPTT